MVRQALLDNLIDLTSLFVRRQATHFFVEKSRALKGRTENPEPMQAHNATSF
jgi:hypothetical protein